MLDKISFHEHFEFHASVMCFVRAEYTTIYCSLPVATKLNISSTINIFCIEDQGLTPGSKNTSQGERSNWKMRQNMLQNTVVNVSLC